MSLETHVKKAGRFMSEQGLFVGGGLLLGAATYFGLDHFGHNNLFIDHHGEAALMSAVSAYLWTQALKTVNGKSLVKKKKEHARRRLDDLVGAGTATGLALLSEIPQNIIPHTITYAKLIARKGLDYDYMHSLNEIQQHVLKKELATEGDYLLRWNIGLLLSAYAVAKFGSVLSSALLDKNNRPLFTSMGRALIKRLKGRKYYLGHMETEADRHPLFHLELLREAANRSEFDHAFQHMKAYLQGKEEGGATAWDAWMLAGNHAKLSTAYRRHKKDPENSAKHLDLAAAYLRVGQEDDFAKAEETFEELSKKEDERTIDHNILYALFLSERRGKNDPRTQKQWKNAAQLVMADPRTEQESIGETKNKVYVKGSEFTKGTIVFKEARTDITSKIEDLVRNHSTYRTLKLLATFPSQENNLYVLRREPGVTLWEKIERNEPIYDPLCEIVDFLALLHAKMEKGKTEEHLLEKTKSRLTRLDLPKDIQDGILDNYRPIIAALQDAHYVFNKDAHPGNWLFSDTHLFCLDNENLDAIPQEVDLVNLLEHGRYVTIPQKLEMINRYITRYNSYTDNKITDRDEFVSRYFHAVIHRTLNMSSAWSIEERTSLYSKRKLLLENAFEAIHFIKERYAPRYALYKDEYSGLERGLRELSLHFSNG